MSTLCIIDVLPKDVLSHLVSVMFQDFLDLEVDYVSRQLLLDYIHLPRVCKMFAQLLGLFEKQYPINWPQLYYRMAYFKPSWVQPDSEYWPLVRTHIYYSALKPIVHTEIDLFRVRHDLLYRTKKSGKVYKGYLGLKKLKSIKIPKGKIKEQYKKLLTRYEFISNKSKELKKKAAEQHSFFHGYHRIVNIAGFNPI